MKRIISLVVSLTCIMSMVILNTGFKSVENGALSKNRPTITAAYRPTAFGLSKLSDSELAALEQDMNNKKTQIDNFESQAAISGGGIITPDGEGPMTDDITEYNQIGTIPEYQIKWEQRRVSDYLYNYGVTSLSQALLSSITEGYSINVGLQYKYSNALNLSLGASWSKSVSYTVTTTVTVGAHQKGWLEFYPIMDYHYGYLDTYNWLHTTLKEHLWTSLYTVRTIAGNQCDGVFLAYASSI